MTDGLEALQQAEAEARAAVGRWPSDEPPEWWAQFARLLDAYTEAVRATERARASESALRAAAQEVADEIELLREWVLLNEPLDEALEIPAVALMSLVERGAALNATVGSATTGAPWEPSEDQVERAAVAINAIHVSHGRHDPYAEAHAALKAAMGIESGSAG